MRSLSSFLVELADLLSDKRCFKGVSLTGNLGKEEETGGDGQKEGGGPRPSRRGFQSQEGEEGFHDP